jgi:hypothetical protein
LEKLLAKKFEKKMFDAKKGENHYNFEKKKILAMKLGQKYLML